MSRKSQISDNRAVNILRSSLADAFRTTTVVSRGIVQTLGEIMRMRR
jgi:hypothetical protein